MHFNFSNKVVLVAGGAGYLGTPTCQMFADQGATVVIADCAMERAESVAAEIVSGGGKATAVRLDVGDERSAKTAVDGTVSTYGRLDVLVNATFKSIGKSVDELTGEEFDQANQVNITGAFLLAREAARVMTSGGSIVLFSSMYGLVSPDPRTYHPPMNPNPIEYGAAKAAIVQMTKYLAVAWGNKGIRVNAVAPGPFPQTTVQEEHPAFVQRLVEKVPMGRIGRHNEIAGTVVFLASDESSYMSGQTLSVDGGWTAW